MVMRIQEGKNVPKNRKKLRSPLRRPRNKQIAIFKKIKLKFQLQIFFDFWSSNPGPGSGSALK
jgi:hypothetical protein